MIDAKLEQVMLEKNVLEGVLQLVGDITTARIIFQLAEQDHRFMELHKALGVSSKTLSARLKELQGEQLVIKTLYAEVPPRSVYALTEKGTELVSIMQGILEWDSTWKSR
ncbi:helix-turn-helix transcriptional regulator [Candidatus Woesearchaeota archaeon]|nr:helix-turn-helix transcriptional regulator [Candidatus Woesearchaeota archaeon]